MKKNICIHAHFYQPPRENPWLETVELQDSAYPFHDWNERITTECYAPNAESRILNPNADIINIVNNFSRINFNFGPTLLSWIKEKHPELLQKIIEADAESKKYFNNHGSAIAQAYNHMILPLANSADKYTQVYWGIEDFRFYFNRYPEGMWLPETAANTDTLEVLAQHNIKYTILAPNQAHQVRKIGEHNWHDVSNNRIDITMPYLCRLPSGKTINLFFYNGEIAKDIAFGSLLQNGETFAKRFLAGFTQKDSNQLVHIATDGETYGHHKPHGDMVLAYALHYLEEQPDAELTIYAKYLEENPPTHEVMIHENSAWSCAHGIERWRSHCGCCSGMHGGWQQHWRGPLREALDFVRDYLADRYEEGSKKFLKNPWGARNDYIRVLQHRRNNWPKFLREHTRHTLKPWEEREVLKWLEIQRHAMLMYTSCGWFFDEISGLETTQVIMYADRAIQLAKELGVNDLETQFAERLENAPSNLREHRNGRKIYEKWIKPARLSLIQVLVHYAISSLFKEYEDEAQIYCFGVKKLKKNFLEAGKIKFVMGTAFIKSDITFEEATVDFAAIHYGDQNLNCAVRYHKDEAAYNAMEKEMSDCFKRGDTLEIIKLFDKHFEDSSYTLRHLFKDEQRKLIKKIVESSFNELEVMYRQFYDNYSSMIGFLTDLSIPVPEFSVITEYILTTELKNKILQDKINNEEIYKILDNANHLKVEVNKTDVEYLLQEQLEKVAERFQRRPSNLGLLDRLIEMTDLINNTVFEVNLWKTQNIVFKLQKELRQAKHSERWLQKFRTLCHNLKINAL